MKKDHRSSCRTRLPEQTHTYRSYPHPFENIKKWVYSKAVLFPGCRGCPIAVEDENPGGELIRSWDTCILLICRWTCPALPSPRSSQLSNSPASPTCPLGCTRFPGSQEEVLMFPPRISPLSELQTEHCAAWHLVGPARTSGVRIHPLVHAPCATHQSLSRAQGLIYSAFPATFLHLHSCQLHSSRQDVQAGYDQVFKPLIFVFDAIILVTPRNQFSL